MIKYRDFAPRLIKSGILRGDTYESFDHAVVAANEWLATQKIELVTVETVVLPNITSDKSDGTSDARVETEEAMTSINEWFQFLRVWYRE